MNRKWLYNYDEFQKIGLLPEAKELQGKASCKAIANLQAEILLKRNTLKLMEYSDLVAFTAEALYFKALEKSRITEWALMAVFSYGIEEGKRMERARRKGGAKI